MIISGPGPIKEKFYRENYLPNDLKKKVIGLVDTSYTEEQGIRETVERGKDLIKETDFAKEQELLKKFFTKLGKSEKDVVYGMEDTMEAIKENRAEIVLVAEDIENLDKIERLCEEHGTELEYISTNSQEAVQFRNIGGIGAILKF